MNKLVKTKNIVEQILKEDKRARDSDKWLIIETLRAMGFKIYLDYDELQAMPSFESITRARRYWQNTKGKYPSSKQLEEGRSIQEQNFKEVFR